MSTTYIQYEVEERIATIRLNRAEKRNALNPEMIRDLTAALWRASDDSAVKVIVLQAEGSAFSAGADLAYLQQLQQNSYSENLDDSLLLKNLYTSILRIPKVVIAQVEGHAIAGGCGLATACDIIFAVPEALFGYTEVKLGFVPALVSCLLMRKTSETIVKRILFTGELFNAETALQYNLITFVTNKEEIRQKVRNFALDLCESSSGNALAVTKKLINETTFASLETSLTAAAALNAEVRQSDDFKKGIGDFLEKKKTSW